MTFLALFMSWIYKASVLTAVSAVGHLPFLGFWVWVCNNYYCYPAFYVWTCYIRNGYTVCN